MKIGLVGEAPNDIHAIQNLLSRRYFPPHYEFFPLINNIHGSELENQKTKRLLQREYEVENPDIIIFIRDLDALNDDKTAIRKRKKYYSDFNRVVNKKGILLLNIFEIEALIIADIEAFNRRFNCRLVYNIDPMDVEHPKEDLKRQCQQFNESFNPELFKLLAFDTVTQNCTYFKEFIIKLEKKDELTTDH